MSSNGKPDPSGNKAPQGPGAPPGGTPATPRPETPPQAGKRLPGALFGGFLDPRPGARGRKKRRLQSIAY